MLEIKSKEKGYSVNFPTSIKEFTPELLDAITENVKLPKFHAIVILCYEVKLFDFAINIRANKPANTKVFPLLAKIDSEDADKINSKVSDKIIIDRTTIERGHHLVIPIMITSDNATNFLKQDEKLMTNIIKGQVKDSHVDDLIVQQMIDNKYNNIFIVEFKIIPINDIKGSISNGSKVIDPFKIVSKEQVN